jgi:hypothetical protein
MNVLGISSNTYNILATLFKHFFAARAYTLIKGVLYLQWRRGRGDQGSENCQCCRKLSENCPCCRKLSKMSTGGGGVAEDLKCCRRKNFLVCRKKFSVCRKSTALAPPPKKNQPQNKTWDPRRHCYCARCCWLQEKNKRK